MVQMGTGERVSGRHTLCHVSSLRLGRPGVYGVTSSERWSVTCRRSTRTTTAVGVQAGHTQGGQDSKGYSMHCKRISCVPGKSASLRFRAPCQNFFCSHRLRRACQNQALPRETHRADKRPGCASWSRGPAEALTVLRPRTRLQTPTVFPANGGGSSLPWFLFWCSVTSLSPSTAQVHGSPSLSRMKEATSFVPTARQTAHFVCSA
jgi:hypothetical protein